MRALMRRCHHLCGIRSPSTIVKEHYPLLATTVIAIRPELHHSLSYQIQAIVAILFSCSKIVLQLFPHYQDHPDDVLFIDCFLEQTQISQCFT